MINSTCCTFHSALANFLIMFKHGHMVMIYLTPVFALIILREVEFQNHPLKGFQVNKHVLQRFKYAPLIFVNSLTIVDLGRHSLLKGMHTCIWGSWFKCACYFFNSAAFFRVNNKDFPFNSELFTQGQVLFRSRSWPFRVNHMRMRLIKATGDAVSGPLGN